MNGKKAKAIRRLAAANGQYKKEPDYRAKETKKMAYFVDNKGIPRAQEVTKVTLINLSRIGYRRIKQAYSEGKIAI